MAGIEKLALPARGPAPQGSLKFAPPGPPAGMSHPTKSGDFVGFPGEGREPRHPIARSVCVCRTLASRARWIAARAYLNPGVGPVPC